MAPPAVPYLVAERAVMTVMAEAAMRIADIHVKPSGTKMDALGVGRFGDGGKQAKGEQHGGETSEFGHQNAPG